MSNDRFKIWPGPEPGKKYEKQQPLYLEQKHHHAVDVDLIFPGTRRSSSYSAQALIDIIRHMKKNPPNNAGLIFNPKLDLSTDSFDRTSFDSLMKSLETSYEKVPCPFPPEFKQEGGSRIHISTSLLRNPLQLNLDKIAKATVKIFERKKEEEKRFQLEQMRLAYWWHPPINTEHPHPTDVELFIGYPQRGAYSPRRSAIAEELLKRISENASTPDTTAE